MLTPLIYVLAFVAVVLVIQTLAGLVFSTGDRNRRVNRRLSLLQSGMSQEQVYAELVRKPVAPAIANDFGLFAENPTSGYKFKNASTAFARRTGSPDAHFFAVSVGIQSETGGNLAEILEGLARVIRGRSTLAKRVKALASEGLASAQILSALPILLVAFFAIVRPTFYTDKFGDPVFWPVVIFILLLYGAGWLMIHRIINFKY